MTHKRKAAPARAAPPTHSRRADATTNRATSATLVKCHVPGCGQPSRNDPGAIAYCPRHVARCGVCGVAAYRIIDTGRGLVCPDHLWALAGGKS